MLSYSLSGISRKKAVEIIKVSAAGDYDRAGKLTEEYIAQVEREKENAEEAIKITQSILSGMNRAGGNDTRSGLGINPYFS